MTRLFTRSLIAAAMSCGAASLAYAQATPAMVSGTGVATVERPAQIMRMQIELSATAPTLKQALAALKDRREAAQAQVETLGADKSTLKFGQVALRNDPNDQRQQMERVVRSRPGRRPGKDGKTPAVPTSQTVAVGLTADWPVAKGTAEQVLLAVNEIQTKVEAADLAGIKEKKSLTPEEEELAEEMAQMHDRYGQEAQQPGKPQFLFIAKITDAERDKALADAFAKAKAQAARTAKAAGAELGGLLRVSDQAAGLGGFDESDYGGFGSSYDSYTMARVQRAAMMAGRMDEDEAMSVQPGAIPVRISVTAAFQLK